MTLKKEVLYCFVMIKKQHFWLPFQFFVGKLSLLIWLLYLRAKGIFLSLDEFSISKCLCYKMGSNGLIYFGTWTSRRRSHLYKDFIWTCPDLLERRITCLCNSTYSETTTGVSYDKDMSRDSHEHKGNVTHTEAIS